MAKLLEGIRVLEFAILAPSRLGMHLADLGAAVIKVEQPPRGDYYRQIGRGFPGGPSLNHIEVNRGKKSLALNARHEKGREIALELARRSHAIIEGMRAGALERLGLGYDAVKKINPGIVYCSISGWGSAGPHKRLGSHGVAFDAWSDIAHVARRQGDGVPYIAPHFHVGTIAGPLYGALAVAAGLVKALQTGEGEFIEVTQAEAAAFWQSGAIMQGLNLGWSTESPWAAPARYQFYETQDGKFVIFQAMEREFFENFCRALARDDLLAYDKGLFVDADPGNEELRAKLAEVFRQKPQSEWVQFFIEANVPGGPVHTLQELTQDPHFLARGNLIEHQYPGVGSMQMTTTPIKVPQTPFDPSPAPRVGEHTDQILEQYLKYDAATIASLRANGVIA